MHYLKGFVVLIISTLIFGSVASAQNSGRYIDVGSDRNGIPFMLDTATMGKVDPEFGSLVSLYQVKGGFMKEILFKPSCSENRLWLQGMRYFDQSGTKISQSKQEQEFPVQPDSPASRTMQYYCRSINASGW